MTWAADESLLIVHWALIAITLRRVDGVPTSIPLNSQYYDLGCWWKSVDSSLGFNSNYFEEGGWGPYQYSFKQLVLGTGLLMKVLIVH